MKMRCNIGSVREKTIKMWKKDAFCGKTPLKAL
jgi:hypothetical protein